MLPIHQMDDVWDEDKNFLSTPLYSILMGLGRGPLEAQDQERASSCPLIPMPDLCDWLCPCCEGLLPPPVSDPWTYPAEGYPGFLCSLRQGGGDWESRDAGDGHRAGFTSQWCGGNGSNGTAAQRMARVAQTLSVS